MEFGQLIECNQKNIFFKNHAKNEADRLVPDTFYFYKSVILGIRMLSGAQFQYISTALNLAYDKNKLYKTLDY